MSDQDDYYTDANGLRWRKPGGPIPNTRPIDRSNWGPGPWDGEPDHLEWRHAGLPCLLHRNRNGAWCGYVAVPPGHRYHGVGYDDVEVEHPHGGLTYAEKCMGAICHVPAPGESDDVWWLGFDANHGSDVAPAMKAWERANGFDRQWPWGESYKDVAYMRAETERLAEQLAEVG